MEVPQLPEHVSIEIISRMFNTIYQGLEKQYITRIEEEVAKIIPSEDSIVYMGIGYGEYDNTIDVSVYVSNPLPQEQVTEVRMDKVFFSWLVKANVDKLPNLFRCIDKMEKKGGNSYSIDGVPVFYNEDIKEYYFHFTITKE